MIREPRYSVTQVACLAPGCIALGVAVAAIWGLVPRSQSAPATDAAAAFHLQYYNSAVWTRTKWLGTQVLKNPLDMWILQEILAETRPDVLVETGTFKGGSALYFASLFDLIGRGRVYTIDIEDHPGRPAHPRIMFRNGSSTADATVAWIRSQTKAGERVMVALDSAHTKKHVLTELDMYAPLVTPGMYLVVEDSNIGHTFAMGSPEYRDGGPWDAIAEWLPKHPEFERDAAREKFGVTFNPGGWLRRVR